ncbi:hypothetical protein PFISCL1PPCAC_20887, partial [Pristionchus fissidentatus]
ILEGSELGRKHGFTGGFYLLEKTVADVDPLLSYRTLARICASPYEAPLVLVHADIGGLDINNNKDGQSIEIRLLNSETKVQVMAARVERRDDDQNTAYASSSDVFIHRSMGEGVDAVR